MFTSEIRNKKIYFDKRSRFSFNAKYKNITLLRIYQFYLSYFKILTNSKILLIFIIQVILLNIKIDLFAKVFQYSVISVLR